MTPNRGVPRRRIELPVLPAAPPPLRADAARNRDRLLDAAGRLFDEHGVGSVTLDDVVAAAGVGKGTLYRIFGDKSGLAVALLDERERGLQQRILSGRPPLGPGADPAERAAAFVRAYVRAVAASIDLVRMSQTSRAGARFDTGAHRFWRAHLVYLAGRAGVPEPELTAEVLLAAMTAEQISDWVTTQSRPVTRLAADVATVATRLYRSGA